MNGNGQATSYQKGGDYDAVPTVEGTILFCLMCCYVCLPSISCIQVSLSPLVWIHLVKTDFSHSYNCPFSLSIVHVACRCCGI